jgi:hypothetical protein
MRKLEGQGFDDHPEDDPDRPRVSWTVSILDDCEGCDDTRVELVLEEVGRPGAGLSAHLAPGTARRLRATLARALHEAGEPTD